MQLFLLTSVVHETSSADVKKSLDVLGSSPISKLQKELLPHPVRPNRQSTGSSFYVNLLSFSGIMTNELFNSISLTDESKY